MGCVQWKDRKTFVFRVEKSKINESILFGAYFGTTRHKTDEWDNPLLKQDRPDSPSTEAVVFPAISFK